MASILLVSSKISVSTTCSFSNPIHFHLIFNFQTKLHQSCSSCSTAKTSHDCFIDARPMFDNTLALGKELSICANREIAKHLCGYIRNTGGLTIIVQTPGQKPIIMLFTGLRCYKALSSFFCNCDIVWSRYIDYSDYSRFCSWIHNKILPSKACSEEGVMRRRVLIRWILRGYSRWAWWLG